MNKRVKNIEITLEMPHKWKVEIGFAVVIL
jgi:hypothetical protein